MLSWKVRFIPVIQFVWMIHFKQKDLKLTSASFYVLFYSGIFSVSVHYFVHVFFFVCVPK